MSITVKIMNREEYGTFLDTLQKYGFRWMSGQEAIDPPRYLRVNDLKEGVCGLRRVYIDKKQVGYVPAEIYSPKEQTEMYNQAVSVNEFVESMKINDIL